MSKIWNMIKTIFHPAAGTIDKKDNYKIKNENNKIFPKQDKPLK